jgi:predicted alpha/beta hydrolase family esterase
MTERRQVLFVQGGGRDVHDREDNELVDGLRRELGDGYEVRYPRMPHEEDPSYPDWAAAVRRELAALDDGAVVVGHSVGGTILVHALAERPPAPALAGIVLLAAPFVGPGGWPGDGFELPRDLGAQLPRGVPVHLFHGTGDETVPPSHAGSYASVVPQARLHRLAGRDHQLTGGLSEVARAIRADLGPITPG